MPMVVADIVDPSNTASASCSTLEGMLHAQDDPLAAAATGDETLTPAGEPLCNGLSPQAEAALEWLSELKGGSASSAEVQALNAAVSLFGAVFRLQTSDVRQQLLGHLSTAASKATAKDPRESRGFLSAAPEKSDRGSALTNTCAALLGSLQRLAQKPSRSVLRPELSESFTAVLNPCLSEADVLVRRGAAECVGLLGKLLGEPYVTRFLASVCCHLISVGQREGEELQSSRLGRLGLV